MTALMPRGYRSVTEYRFREEQADAIARVTATTQRLLSFRDMVSASGTRRCSSVDSNTLPVDF